MCGTILPVYDTVYMQRTWSSNANYLATRVTARPFRPGFSFVTDTGTNGTPLHTTRYYRVTYNPTVCQYVSMTHISSLKVQQYVS